MYVKKCSWAKLLNKVKSESTKNSSQRSNWKKDFFDWVLKKGLLWLSTRVFQKHLFKKKADPPWPAKVDPYFERRKKPKKGVPKSWAVTILTLEQNPPERKFLTYIKIFSQEDFALKSKLWPLGFLEHLPIFAGNSHFTCISQLRAGKHGQNVNASSSMINDDNSSSPSSSITVLLCCSSLHWMHRILENLFVCFSLVSFSFKPSFRKEQTTWKDEQECVVGNTIMRPNISKYFQYFQIFANADLWTC